jgi:hypothetical protein
MTIAVSALQPSMGWTRVAIYPASLWARSASVSHRSAISMKKDLCAEKCGLPPPIECIRRRCCVTDRSWASALSCLSCTTLAMSKFGARESRASRGRPGILVSPFRCVGRAPRSADTHRMRGVLTALASERSSISSVIVPADGTGPATAGKRRLRYVCVFWAALGQAAACLYLVTWGADPKAQWLVEN